MKLKNKAKRIIKAIKKTLADEILYTINSHESYGEFAKRFWGVPHHKKNFSKAQVYQAVHRMKKRGWLEEKKIQDRVYYRLTSEGKMRQKLLKLRISMKQKANYSTVVIFDVPESKSAFRQFLRRLLLQNGFIALQKSAFVTGNILTEEFFDILRLMKLLEYMTFIRGKIVHKI